MNVFRGYKIELSQGVWIYSDNKEPCKVIRGCGFCGASNTPEGHDGCVGTLEGVMNAFCGHGVKEEADVQFASGQRFAGKEALNFINKVQI